MAVRKLDKQEWHPYFDQLSKLLEATHAKVEIASLALGTQVQAEWLPLFGIAYDPQDDLVEVALEGLDHMIQKPREIYVDVDAGNPTNLEIVDGDGTRQIVKFKDQLMLPTAKK